MLRNQAWYNENESRSYPIDDAASAIDDSGVLVRNHVLADLQVKFPREAGYYGYVGALTVTPQLVTLVILAVDTPAASSTCNTPVSSRPPVPVAAVTVLQPVEQGRHYPLDSMYPGAGGWVVFGSGVEEPDVYSARFAGVSQSMLSPKAASYYSPLPVQSVAKLRNAYELTGVVQLLGGSDVEIVSAEREIAGVTRDVIVFRLRDTQVEGESRNVFSLYTGPCGTRPESRNCGDPAPIEYLGTVGPDCCGNVFIEFRGCALVADAGALGVVVDCELGLIDACTRPNRLPDSDGNLPNSYTNYCDGLIDVSEFVPLPTPDPDPPSISFDSLTPAESETIADPTLPYLENFEDLTADDFQVVSGEFVFDANDVHAGIGDWSWSTGGSLGLATFNMAVWDVVSDPEWLSYYRRVETLLRIMPASAGSRHNGMLIFNYRPQTGNPERDTYWAAEVDWDEKLLRISWFNGVELVGLVWTSVPTLTLGNWYRLSATIAPAAPPNQQNAWITVYLEGLDDAINVALGPFYLANYAPATGAFGLASERSATLFDSFQVEVYFP